MLFSYDADLLPRVRMIGRIKYAEPWCHFQRTIDEYILYLVRDGNLYLEENGERYHLQAGDMLLLEPNLPHVGYQKAVCDYYYVHFHQDSLRPVPDEQSAMKELGEKRIASLASFNLDEDDATDPITYLPKRFNLKNQEFRSALNRAIEVYDAREEQYKRMAATELHIFLLHLAHEHLLFQNSAHNGSHRRKSEVVVERILKYLNGSYQQKITSELLESQFEVNFDSINRVFADLTGSTIFHYLNAMRIERAKSLIATTDLNFSEIGYLVGIEDRYYFTKQFKKYTGLTPSEYFVSVKQLKREEAGSTQAEA